MLKKIKYMKCEDIMLLTIFANININPTKDEDYKYKDLFLISSQKENLKNKLNVEKVIDKLMFDNYDIYVKIKQIMKKYDNINIKEMFDEQTDKIFLEYKEYIENYIRLYEKIMFETKFEYADIRSVQKFLLMEKMESEIRKENYEVCAKIKKLINEV